MHGPPMRSNPADYRVEAPSNLHDAVTLLSDAHRSWTPIAGGTDLMVQYAAGKLAARNLLSIWNLPELRAIEEDEREIRIGAACTFTDLRENDLIRRELPLLAQVAGWVGGIANQNRGTLGGNIANASPAGDSLPALLAYDAELMLISNRGTRRVPYGSFHMGYKKTALERGELIHSICLPRRQSAEVSYARKAGTRNAQAISKVCIAARARTSAGVLEDVRIAAGSVGPFPLRLAKIERLLEGKRLDQALIDSVSKAVYSEIQPIDDIRSTARYRAAVCANLLGEFLEKLAEESGPGEVLSRWNALPLDAAAAAVLPCCGSNEWAQRLALARPFADENSLFSASDEIWRGLSEADWDQAFRRHPRLGESNASKSSGAQSSAWSAQEQGKIAGSDDSAKLELAEANRQYEKQFGRIFILCATGKTAAEVLEAIRRRLRNDRQTELLEAAEQQRQITRIRLRKWLSE